MILGASTFVEGVDNAFLFILGISLFFLIGILVLIVWFIHKYYHKRHKKAVQIEGSNTLEILWFAIPFLLVMGMFYYGQIGWAPMKRIPEKGVKITANARMWSFSFRYDNGRVTDKLFVPRDTTIILNLNSVDVLHSLYIPAFRVKEDMVPGLANNRMWFEATKSGTYSLFCAEYCGLQHSLMYTDVVVMEPQEFWEWYSDTTAVETTVPSMEDPSEAGRQIVQNKGCTACHSTDGSTVIGPSFLGRFGETITVITDGEEREIVFDEEYVQRSIYQPDFDVVEGFRPGQMLSYEGEVTPEQVDLIVEFLRSLNQ